MSRWFLRSSLLLSAALGVTLAVGLARRPGPESSQAPAAPPAPVVAMSASPFSSPTADSVAPAWPAVPGVPSVPAAHSPDPGLAAPPARQAADGLAQAVASSDATGSSALSDSLAGRPPTTAGSHQVTAIEPETPTATARQRESEPLLEPAPPPPPLRQPRLAARPPLPGRRGPRIYPHPAMPAPRPALRQPERETTLVAAAPKRRPVDELADRDSPPLPRSVEPAPPLADGPAGADLGNSLGQMMQLLEQASGSGTGGESSSGTPSVSDVLKIVETLTANQEATRKAAEAAGIAITPRPSRAAPTADAADQAEPDEELPPVQTLPSTAQIEAGEDGLTIHVQNADLRAVLELLSEQGGLNILASKSVQGTVSASMNGVDVDEALDAILRTVGYVARREGPFVYVGTPQDFDDADRAIDRINTRIYRPNYTPAAELNSLLTPLITPDVGKISVTTAAEVGIGAGGGGGASASSSGGGGSTGGDSFASSEAVVVQDYERVLKQIDQVVAEIDKRPLQVAIEAMILSVRLNDNLQAGVDWELLRSQENLRLGLGQPRQAPIEGGGGIDATTGGAVGAFQYGQAGLTFAFMDASLSNFITFLETIGDTNVIATPRLMCLNKQRAEILIGAQLGYISTTITETSTAQNVQFLEVGAQLKLRPFISSDGLIRMEVHPELSTGSVRTAGGFTLPDKEVTQVTTNIMTRDGCTVIIGGLMREDLNTTSSQIPFLGDLPGVGFFFRKKSETIERRELLVLVTPHIVYDDEAACEGDQGAMEFHRRHQVRADKMSPAGKRLLGRKYFRAAQAAWEAGDARAASRYIRWSIQFDPENRAAIDLRADITQGRHNGPHSGGEWLVDPHLGLDAEPLPEWMLDELGEESPSAEPLHPIDPGTPGPVRHIEIPPVGSALE